jgi:hypothetical protein
MRVESWPSSVAKVTREAIPRSRLRRRVNKIVWCELVHLPIDGKLIKLRSLGLRISNDDQKWCILRFQLRNVDLAWIATPFSIWTGLGAWPFCGFSIVAAQ